MPLCWSESAGQRATRNKKRQRQAGGQILDAISYEMNVTWIVIVCQAKSDGAIKINRFAGAEPTDAAALARLIPPLAARLFEAKAWIARRRSWEDRIIW